MYRMLPKENDVWKHADGSKWIVIKAAVNEERQLEVTIAAMDYSFRIEKWNIDDFLDEVDTENYPECSQKYIFEYVPADPGTISEKGTVAKSATATKKIELVEE